MKTLTLFFLCLILSVTATGVQAQNESGPEKIDISSIIPKNNQYFTKVENSEQWQASYRGKNLASVVVTIMGLKEGTSRMLLLQTNLGERANLPISRNLAIKLLELNGDYD